MKRDYIIGFVVCAFLSAVWLIAGLLQIEIYNCSDISTIGICGFISAILGFMAGMFLCHSFFED